MPKKIELIFSCVEDYIQAKITVDEKTGCWNWGNGKSKNYGYFKYESRCCSAHVAVYELYVKPVPNGMILRHRCDNVKCVNPEHLVPGTKKDNRRDFMERHPRADQLLAEGVLRAQAGCKKFWNEMTKEERQEFCRKRAAIQSKTPTVFSIEARQKMGAARKGQKNSEESKEKVRSGSKKFWENMTEEERQKFCEARSKAQTAKGRRAHSPEAKQKMVQSWIIRKEKALHGHHD